MPSVLVSTSIVQLANCLFSCRKLALKQRTCKGAVQLMKLDLIWLMVSVGKKTYEIKKNVSVLEFSKYIYQTFN